MREGGQQLGARRKLREAMQLYRTPQLFARRCTTQLSPGQALLTR